MWNEIDNHSHLQSNVHTQASIEAMYVCICNAITESQIRRAAEAGIEDLRTLQRELGVGAGCGSCSEQALQVLRGGEPRLAPVGRTTPRMYRPVAV